METLTNLRLFFDAFNASTIWQRIFSFSAIRALSYRAMEEAGRLGELVRATADDKAAIVSDLQMSQLEKTNLQKQLEEALQRLNRAELQWQSQTSRLDMELKQTNEKLRSREMTLAKVGEGHAQREKDYQVKFGSAMSIQNLFEKEMRKLEDLKLKEQQAAQEKERRTWSEHENKVQMAMKRICSRYGLEYVTEFSFRGRPDNAIRVAGELIVFDAKSPAGTDLGNFRSYIKQQCEAAKKYAEHDGVRKDVYLVVPANSVDALDNLSFDLGTYRIYVITPDALEPVILALQQLEGYAFVDQLSPEERQSICRVIGSLINASKRKIQVDQFFNGHLLDLIRKVQTEIPESMQDEIARNEKAMKLNPPTDKRAKEISSDVLMKVHNQLESHALSLDAPTPRMIEVIAS